MRVVFIDNVCNHLNPKKSGHSDIVWAMAEELYQQGIETVIVAPYEAKDVGPTNVLVASFRGLKNADRNGLSKIRQVIRAVKVVKKLPNIDIVHVTDAFSTGITSLLLRKVPIVFTTSGNIHQRQHSDYKLDRISAAFYYFVTFFAARLTKMIVATSEEMVKWWRVAGANRHNIRMIPLGVNSAQGHDGAPEGRSHAQCVNVLFVGRMVGENRPEHLNKLVSLISGKISYRVGIVGNGPMLKTIQSMLSEFDEVKFYGALDSPHLWELYKEFDVLVITRENGATPRVALEAMANGLPVIGFRGTGLEGYVLSGENGFIVSPGNIEEMARIIIAMAIDPDRRLALGREARRWIYENFEWKRIVTRILYEVYNDILNVGTI